jgi:predicted DNA-binding transcriptional regulator YafY
VWCELRTDFRTFRLDHIAALQLLERRFEQKRGQRLQDYLRRVQAEMARQKAQGLDTVRETHGE